MLIWTSRNIPNVGFFSAYAEVFPLQAFGNSLRSFFLCLRRGVSDLDDFVWQLVVFSLPTQRCFSLERKSQIHLALFSAYAEVFPKTCRQCLTAAALFSAYAEVFPYRVPALHLAWAFLCLRRGVSVEGELSKRVSHFSLPTQRCFSSNPHF